MRKISIALAAAVLAHAGLREGADSRTRAHQSYLAGRYAEAEAGYRAALTAFGAERSLARAAVLENLGVAIREQGRGREARPMMEEALRELAALAGAQSPEAVRAASNLARLDLSIGELDMAEELARRAGDPKTLAAVYISQRRFPEALKLLHELLSSADAASAVTLYGNLSAASLGMGQMDEAEAYARQGLELARCTLPEGHPARAAVLNNLAQACRFTGRYMEAERDYREAIDIWEKSRGPSDPDYARGLMNLAAFYHDRGREAGAEQLYLRAAAVLEKNDPALALVARNELSDVLRAELRYTESRKLSGATLRQMEAILPADDPRLARARANRDRLAAEMQRIAAVRSKRR